MSENAASTRANDWQTIAQAAKSLGVSERTVRRAAMMPENAAQTRQATRQTRTGTRQSTLIAPELVEKLREQHQQNTAPELIQGGETRRKTDNTAEIKTATPAHERGATLPTVTEHQQEHGSKTATPAERGDDATARVLAERECELLREALQRERQNADQWRAQVEAANRDAAELRAALRKALDTMPKAIEASDRNETHKVESTAYDTHEKQPTTAPATKKREPRPLWKVVLGVR